MVSEGHRLASTGRGVALARSKDEHQAVWLQGIYAINATTGPLILVYPTETQQGEGLRGLS